ncbi:MAG TPA: hypothetical protein PKL06_06850, partial [Chitinophagales bacterium]|nr:hypothetical protein [Chitinophagales bacterium]
MNRKRILITGALALLVIGLVLVWYFFIRARHTGVINAMPDDVVLFFDIQNNKAFDEFIRYDAAMQSAGEMPLFGKLFEDYALYTTLLSARPDYRTDLYENRCLAGAFSSGKGGVDYLFLLDVDEAKPWKKVSDMPELNGVKPKLSTHVFEKETIYELNYPELDIAFSYATVNDVFIYSTTAVLVENAILQLKKGDPVSEQSGFSKVKSAMEPAPFSVFIQMKKWADYAARIIDNSRFASVMRMGNYADWIGLNLQHGTNGIQVSGYCSTLTESTLNTYTGVVQADMHPAVPANTAILYRVHTDQLAERLAAGMKPEQVNRDFFDYWSPWMDKQLLVGISESLDANFLKRAFVIIPASDQKLAESKLKNIAVADTLLYHDMQWMHIASGEVIGTLANMQVEDTTFGVWMDNALVIAFDKQQLFQMIDAYQNKTSLSSQPDYQSFKKEVSAAYNTSLYLNLQSCQQLLRGWISDKYIDTLSGHFDLLQKFPRLEFQFTSDKDLYLVNGFISFTEGAERTTGLLWSVNVDAPVLHGPYTVLNEITGQKNIVIQDTAKILYMISANGDVLWKRQMPSELMSDIHEVDFYGNDKTQYLFNTAEGIYMLDVQGEPVEGFPITLTTPMSGPVSVFKSTRSDYRFFVPCENGHVYGYYKDGKPIAGWNPMRNVGVIRLPMLSLPTSKGQGIVIVHDDICEVRSGTGAGLAKFKLQYQVQDIKRMDSVLFVVDTGGVVYT